MSRKGLLMATITTLYAGLGSTPVYAQTELDTFDFVTRAELTGADDDTSQSGVSLHRVDTDSSVSHVCQETVISHAASTVTREPFSRVEISGGMAELTFADQQASPVPPRGYTFSLFYGQCSASSNLLSSLGLSVPSQFDITIAGYDNTTDTPTVIVTAYVTNGGNTSHTMQITPTAAGSQDLTFSGSSFTPALPTSGTLNYVSVQVTGTLLTYDSQVIELTNFTYQ